MKRRLILCLPEGDQDGLLRGGAGQPCGLNQVARAYDEKGSSSPLPLSRPSAPTWTRPDQDQRTTQSERGSQGHHGDVATRSIAVNAIRRVKEAAPGLVTMARPAHCHDRIGGRPGRRSGSDMDLTDWIIRAAIFGVLAAVLIGTFPESLRRRQKTGKEVNCCRLKPTARGTKAHRHKGTKGHNDFSALRLCAFAPLCLFSCVRSGCRASRPLLVSFDIG